MSIARNALFLIAALLSAAQLRAQVADKNVAVATNKWGETIENFEELDRRSEYPADSILFMGSSSIRLWETLAEDMAPYPVIQRGYGGAKFQDLAVFAKRIVHPHAFRAVVIFVGNDIAGKKTDIEPEEVAKLFTDVLETVREKDAGAPVFLIEVTPTESRWGAWPRIAEANAAMAAVCEAREDVHFIATAKHFLGADGKPRAELFRGDRLHLNADGYKLWKKLIRGELEKVFGVKAETATQPK